jgi:superfamily I DNA/RNA helicase
MVLNINVNGNLSKMSDIKYFIFKDFEKALNRALLGGGVSKRAAVVAKAILGSLNQDDPFINLTKPTNWGESRIKHSVKYDLGDGWRLVTLQNKKACHFLFMGNHDDADHWLKVNQGLSVGAEGGRTKLVPGIGELYVSEAQLSVEHHLKPLISYLPENLADTILDNLPRSTARALEQLDGETGTEKLEMIVSSVDDQEKKQLIIQVFNQLIAGNIQGAIDVVRFDRNEFPSIDELNDQEAEVLIDGPDVRRLRFGSPEYEQWLLDFERRSTWQDWFLYLHPEQETAVFADHEGPSQLSGVSGSGKTCIAVRRAVRLAEAGEPQILFVTLNRSLSGMLKQLIDSFCVDPIIRSRITVTSYFELAQTLLQEFEPENINVYQDITWKTDEHVDEIFREYYRLWLNFRDAEILSPLHMSLNGRGVSGEDYLRQEFDWIRSALKPEERGKYLQLVRKGRKFPILGDRRQSVLDGLIGWEKKMRLVGVIDYMGLSSALAKHAHKIEKRYDHILIDEAQDFGTTELSILRKLVAFGKNDMFLCGDIAQTILAKHRSLPDAGINLISKIRIQQNYRNSREILMAAYEVLTQNLSDDLMDSEDLEILDPKLANFRGSIPNALVANSLEEEIAYARKYAETRIGYGAKNVCIAFAGFSTRDIHQYAEKCGVAALDGTYDPSSDSVVFCDLEQTKGYEFDTVIILNCVANVLPSPNAPEEEIFRDACKLYVAMTRAQRELILSFHNEASRWVQSVGDNIATSLWAEVEELNTQFLCGVPSKLLEMEPDTNKSHEFKLTGLEFVYTELAIGLSVDVQFKLIDLVDGRGLRSASTRTKLKWKSMEELLYDLKMSRTYDSTIGTNAANELRETLNNLYEPNLI